MEKILYTILIVAVVALIFVLIDMRLLPKIRLKDFDRWVVTMVMGQIAMLAAIASAVYGVMKV